MAAWRPNLRSLALLPLLFLTGCMTPERAVRESDAAADALARAVGRRVTGETNGFDVARPSERLRAQLMLAQALPGTVSATGAVTRVLPDPLLLRLSDALQVGARNDSGYQERKEAVFAAALEVDRQQHLFESSFEGLLSGGIAREAPAEGAAETRLTGEAGVGLKRQFARGANLAANLALDVVRLLTGDAGSALGLAGDATFTLPLLRGAGAAAWREPLTQGECNLLYAVHDLAAYRQRYAVDVAAGYYGVLEAMQQETSLRENEVNLTTNYVRALHMAESGRLLSLEVDRARQELLSTGSQLVRARTTLDTQLDEFKRTLGLPVDARLALDPVELERLQTVMRSLAPPETADPANPADPAAAVAELPAWDEARAVAAALTQRHDLAVSRAKVADAQRAVEQAADALRADLTVEAGASYDSRDLDGKARDRAGHANVELGLPWDRTAERIDYRQRLLDLEAATRTVEAAEDQVKLDVRKALRSLAAAASAYAIQCEAVRVAERRVRSTDLFQQAGRAEMRDVLEARASLLNSRNDLVSAMIRYRLAGLELGRDTASLEMTEEGLWREPDTRFAP